MSRLVYIDIKIFGDIGITKKGVLARRRLRPCKVASRSKSDEGNEWPYASCKYFTDERTFLICP